MSSFTTTKWSLLKYIFHRTKNKSYLSSIFGELEMELQAHIIFDISCHKLIQFWNIAHLMQLSELYRMIYVDSTQQLSNTNSEQKQASSYDEKYQNILFWQRSDLKFEPSMRSNSIDVVRQILSKGIRFIQLKLKS